VISLISLNWNTTDMLIRLYESAIKNTLNEFQLVVLDNGSNDLEYQKLYEYFKPKKLVIVIRLEKNIGFAAGNNCALKHANGTEIIFINSDIIIEEEKWDEKFSKVLNSDNVGIAGCAYHPLIWTKSGDFKIQPLATEPVESQSVQGAFFGMHGLIIQKIVLQDKFLFDENFKFAQYEETDLCFRIRKMGLKVIWFPLKHVHDYNHSGTKTNNYQLSDEIRNYEDFKNNVQRNKALFIEKHKDIL